MHDLVHNKGCPSHITGILKEGYAEKEYENIRQEHRHPAHAADYSVDNQISEEAVAHQIANMPTETPHPSINPIHGILPNIESQLEHGPDEKNENRKTEEPVGQNHIDPVREVAPVPSRLLNGLLERPVNESIPAVGHQRL